VGGAAGLLAGSARAAEVRAASSSQDWLVADAAAAAGVTGQTDSGPGPALLGGTDRPPVTVPGTAAQGSSLAGCEAGSHGGVPDTRAWRLGVFGAGATDAQAPRPPAAAPAAASAASALLGPPPRFVV
jgi:hypothetical protein